MKFILLFALALFVQTGCSPKIVKIPGIQGLKGEKGDKGEKVRMVRMVKVYQRKQSLHLKIY
jgi:hypothetical protein